MQITVRGIKGEDIKRKELVFAANFFGEFLMKRLYQKLNVDFKFEPLDPSVNGYCHVFDDDKHPRWFEIEIRKGMPRNEILSTIAHELVHVKQFARRELLYLDTRDLPKYRGERFNTKNLDYWDQPWEIEAHGREVGLMHRYKSVVESDATLLKNLTT